MSTQFRWLWPAYFLTAFGIGCFIYFLATLPKQGDPSMGVLLLAMFSLVGAFHFYFAYSRHVAEQGALTQKPSGPHSNASLQEKTKCGD